MQKMKLSQKYFWEIAVKTPIIRPINNVEKSNCRPHAILTTVIHSLSANTYIMQSALPSNIRSAGQILIIGYYFMRCSLRDPTLCCESECAQCTILATSCPFYLQKNSVKYFERKVGYPTNGPYLWHAQIYPSGFKVRYELGKQERKPCLKSIFPGFCMNMKHYCIYNNSN